MTKENFLKMVETSTLDATLKKEYLYKYENLLAIVKPQQILIQDLNEFEKEYLFEIFIRNNDYEKIKSKLSDIYKKLNNWLIYNYIPLNIKEIADVTKGLAHTARTAVFKHKWDKIMHKRSHWLFILFIVLFCILSGAVAIFSFLEMFKVLKTNGEISAICGILDFINGIVFFIVERIDDAKKNSMEQKCDEALGNTEININPKNIDKRKFKTKLKNSNNNVIVNGDISVDLDDYLYLKGNRKEEFL
ncbi:MAG: hypothetical protein NC087_01100 [Anaeroplasma bactoclasticum]|nr:hypothetical protein [Anaeroplasma bactoclasticum]